MGKVLRCSTEAMLELAAHRPVPVIHHNLVVGYVVAIEPFRVPAKSEDFEVVEALGVERNVHES